MRIYKRKKLVEAINKNDELISLFLAFTTKIENEDDKIQVIEACAEAYKATGDIWAEVSKALKECINSQNLTVEELSSALSTITDAYESNTGLREQIQEDLVIFYDDADANKIKDLLDKKFNLNELDKLIDEVYDEYITLPADKFSENINTIKEKLQAIVKLCDNYATDFVNIGEFIEQAE